MRHSHRVELSGAPAAQDPRGPATSFTVEAVVLEVLAGYGLAHVRAADGSTFGLTVETPGIHFADVHEGQRVRVEVTRKFSHVLHAQLLGESSPRTVRGSNEKGGARR